MIKISRFNAGMSVIAVLTPIGFVIAWVWNEFLLFLGSMLPDFSNGGGDVPYSDTYLLQIYGLLLIALFCSLLGIYCLLSFMFAAGLILWIHFFLGKCRPYDPEYYHEWVKLAPNVSYIGWAVRILRKIAKWPTSLDVGKR